LLLHTAFHLLAFVEVYITLRWLLADASGGVPGPGPTAAQALILTALDRLVIIAFKFVPFRIGVDEASSGGMAAVLGWPPAVGVALAIVKKVRSLAWTAIGLVLIARHPAQAGPASGLPGSEPARRT
jgi:hypothetical protein